MKKPKNQYGTLKQLNVTKLVKLRRVIDADTVNVLSNTSQVELSMTENVKANLTIQHIDMQQVGDKPNNSHMLKTD